MIKTLDVIQPHPTWEVNDPSKLTEFMRCARKYFYRYMLGWNSEYPNNDLVFGGAWHLSAEHFLRNGYTTESLYEASRLFLDHYRKHFDSSSDDLFVPKSPTNALQALAHYAHTFQSDARLYETLWTEIAGIVSIGAHNLYFKIDAVLREQDTGRILFLDHKTSKYKSHEWGDHWIMSTQMLTYTHVLYCLYPKEEIEGGKVRCSFFYKPRRGETEGRAEFDEALIAKTPKQMQTWIVRMNRWMDLLAKETERLLEDDSPSRDVMASFPMNDTACFDFGKKCTYFDLCNAWPNPLARAESPPIGLKVEFWDPRDAETIRETVDLT